MNLGLDWDGTVTAAPDVFARFCADMRSLGHKVYIVTMRYPSESKDIVDKWAHLVDGVFSTSREAKHLHMEAEGINIHVWIDDTPRAVHESAVQIWGHSYPEGHIHTPVHD